MRIAVISDTHVSPEASAFVQNLAAVRHWIQKLRPDLVAHLGDGTVDGPRAPSQYQFLKDTLCGLPCPIRWLPGNHDIGEDAVAAEAAGEAVVSQQALSAWRNILGPDYWSIHTDGWQIIGLDSLLFGRADTEGSAQWTWLENELSSGSAKLGVMLHKPLFRDAPTDTEQHPRYIPAGERSRLWNALKTRDLRFILSGHTHQLRQTRVAGVEIVWAPSSAYRIPDAAQETIGRKLVGTLLLELGGADHIFAFVEPKGVTQHNIADHPDVYPDLAVKIARSRGGSHS